MIETFNVRASGCLVFVATAGVEHRLLKPCSQALVRGPGNEAMAAQAKRLWVHSLVFIVHVRPN